MTIQNTDFYTIAAANTSEVHAADSAHGAEKHDSGEHTEQSAGGHGGESEGIAALGLDPFAIGAQLLTFLVLFWFVKKFALDGVVKNLQKRHDDINRGLHLTAELDEQKASLDAEVAKTLKKARTEADAIIAEAHEETGRMVAAAEQKANNQAEEILRVAEGKIERDVADARKGLKSEMAGLITEATEAILGEKLDQNSDRKLVERYLNESLK